MADENGFFDGNVLFASADPKVAEALRMAYAEGRRAALAEVEPLRDRIARLANSIQKCDKPCAQCQQLARWCTDGLDLPPVDPT